MKRAVASPMLRASDTRKNKDDGSVNFVSADTRDDEAELLAVYRDSLTNDRMLLPLMIQAWAALSPAQRQAVYRISDLFVSASRWRRDVGRDESVVLDLDALAKNGAA